MSYSSLPNLFLAVFILTVSAGTDLTQETAQSGLLSDKRQSSVLIAQEECIDEDQDGECDIELTD